MRHAHVKLSSLSTIDNFCYTVGQERSWLVKTRDGKEADIINKQNRRQLEIQKLRTEINSINKQYKKTSDEKKEGLRQLRFILRDKRNHLQKAGGIKRSMFVANPYKFTKTTLKGKKTGIYRVRKKKLNNTYQKHTLMRINGKILDIVSG